MTFRTRILLGFGVVLLLPLVVFGLPIRALMLNRLTAEYGRRVASLVGVIRTDLEQESAGIAGRLQALRDAVAGDNGFREAALRGGNRAYLLDYAGNAMRLAGLAMLQIQDDSGRIVSSGHFRNEFDRLEPDLPRLLAAAPGGMALVRARTPEGPVVALARVDSLRLGGLGGLGGKRFTLVGGVAVNSAFVARLARDSELTVSVALPPDTLARLDSATQVVGELAVPFVAEGNVGEGRLVPARIVVTHSLASLAAPSVGLSQFDAPRDPRGDGR